MSFCVKNITDCMTVKLTNQRICYVKDGFSSVAQWLLSHVKAKPG